MYDNTVYVKNTHMQVSMNMLNNNKFIILYNKNINKISRILYFHNNKFKNVAVFDENNVSICIDINNIIYTFSLYSNIRYVAIIFDSIYDKVIDIKDLPIISI